MESKALDSVVKNTDIARNPAEEIANVSRSGKTIISDTGRRMADSVLQVVRKQN